MNNVKFKERSKGISFVFVTHNREKEVFDYVNELDKITNGKIDLIVIFDSEYSVDEKYNKKNVKFYSNGENIGKLNSLIKWKNSLTKKFIKIIDSDDCVNYLDAIKLTEISIDFNENFFYLHKACKIYKENEYYGKISLDKNEINEMIKTSKDINWKIPPNAKTIYSTFIFDILENVKLLKQNYYNDDLLSIVNFLNTSENINLDIEPYIQYHSLGQTSVKSKKRYFEQLILHKNLYIILKNGPFIIREKINFDLGTFKKRLNAQMENNNIKKSIFTSYRIINSAKSFLNITHSKKSKIPLKKIIVNRMDNENSSELISGDRKIIIQYPDETSNYGLKEISNQNQIYDLTFFRNEKNISNFIDVGCNIGLSTIWAKIMFGDKINVSSYEPSIELKKFYLENTKIFSNVFFDNSALSIENGEGIFYFSNSHSGSSTLSKGMTTNMHDTSYKVVKKSIVSEIDNILKKNSGPTMLKIDIEGGEDEFIEKDEFLNLLKKIDYFMFELHGDIDKQYNQIKTISSIVPEENIAFDMQFNFPKRVEGIINYRKVFGKEINWKNIDNKIKLFKMNNK